MLAIYGFALRAGHGESAARSQSFITLVVANISLILSSRSIAHSFWTTLRLPNPALWWIIMGALAALAVVTGLPVLKAFFRFGDLSVKNVLISFLAGVASLAWHELLKSLRPAAASGTA